MVIITRSLCSDGGAGGEKVLYQAISAIQKSREYNDHQVIVYSGSDKAPKEILDHVKSRFGLQISPVNLSFVKLPSRGSSLKAEHYPRLTIVF